MDIPFLSLKDVTALHGAEINEAVIDFKKEDNRESYLKRLKKAQKITKDQ